jgi:hypothetical protein
VPVLQSGWLTPAALCRPLAPLPRLTQRALVQQQLTGACKEVLVASVDSVQGREADAVVLLTTRSNARRELGFVSDAQRANVGLSRARHALVVLGDKGGLQADTRVWRGALAAAEARGMRTVRSAGAFAEGWVGWVRGGCVGVLRSVSCRAVSCWWWRCFCPARRP